MENSKIQYNKIVFFYNELYKSKEKDSINLCDKINILHRKVKDYKNKLHKVIHLFKKK